MLRGSRAAVTVGGRGSVGRGHDSSNQLKIIYFSYNKKSGHQEVKRRKSVQEKKRRELVA